MLWPLPSDSDLKSWQMRAEAWDHPLVMIGGSDAGAHLDRMCGAPYTTSFLADSLRGRQLVSLERCVQLMTADAGRSSSGCATAASCARATTPISCASIRRRSRPVRSRLLDDLPGGTSRLYADAIGVPHVFVNGTRDRRRRGAPTGARPGTVLRSGRDTYTVPIPADA